MLSRRLEGCNFRGPLYVNRLGKPLGPAHLSRELLSKVVFREEIDSSGGLIVPNGARWMRFEPFIGQLMRGTPK